MADLAVSELIHRLRVAKRAEEREREMMSFLTGPLFIAGVNALMNYYGDMVLNSFKTKKSTNEESDPFFTPTYQNQEHVLDNYHNKRYFHGTPMNIQWPTWIMIKCKYMGLILNEFCAIEAGELGRAYCYGSNYTEQDLKRWLLHNEFAREID